MISKAILAGSYREAVDCIKFYNLERSSCIIIQGLYVAERCLKELRNWQIILADNCQKNSAFPVIQQELARRMRPELNDCVIGGCHVK